MKKLKLTLASPDGVVLNTWTIAEFLEDSYDVEDLETEPECDFYLDDRWNSKEDIGEEVHNEAKCYFNSTREGENKNG